jgi:hypothetical protein
VANYLFKSWAGVSALPRLLGVVALSMALLYAADVNAQIVTSGATQISVGVGSTEPNGASREPVAPPTGDFILFSSSATNLSSGFIDGTSSVSPNIYRYSPDSGVELVSVNPQGVAPGKVSGENLLRGCFSPAVSAVGADGSYAVAFASDAQDLVNQYIPPAIITATQVYLRIPASNKTILVSKPPSASSTNSGANGSSDQPTVALVQENPAVYRVCFRSSAIDLVAGQDDPEAIYCRDATVTNQIVTLSATVKIKTDPLDGALGEPVLSARGTELVFSSNATIIGSFGKNIYDQVYLYSFVNQTFSLITKTSAGNIAQGNSGVPAISGDGSVVSFRYDGSSVDGTPDLSGFEGNTKILLIKYDVNSDAYTQINSNSEGTPSNGELSHGRVDSSGRYFVFSDSGTNLVSSPDVSGLQKTQVYFKDTQTSEVLCMSVTGAQEPGVDDSGINNPTTFFPPLAIGHLDSNATNPFAAFLSFAPNLASVGTPSSVKPFAFRATVETPTPTPTPTPTATPQQLRNNLVLRNPPQVEILPQRPDGLYDIFITLRRFVFNSTSAKSVDRWFAEAVRRGKISYQVEIRKAGSKNRITRIISRNTTTIRKLTPGRYSVRYKVIGVRGTVRAESRFSPRTTITLG